MIEIISKETLFTYNLYHITKAFFPEAEIRQCVDGEQEPLVKLTVDGGSRFSVAEEASELGKMYSRKCSARCANVL